MAQSKTTIYLGDLVHNFRGKGPFTFPLNLGYVASYAQAYYKDPDSLEFRFFKFPADLVEAVRKSPPDIVGLSNYTWNENLNIQMLQLIREEFPDILLMMGGPNFNTWDADNYFPNHPFVDYYVVNQGETGFLNLLNMYSAGELPHVTGKAPAVDNLAYFDAATGKAIMGDVSSRYADLDVIPSPYLNGMLDEFFECENLTPIIETMRGCPFSCSFCAWGDDWLRKSNKFSLERVNAELEYIARHVKHTSYLYLADSNFGMLKRDKEIATAIRDLCAETNFPANVWATWAKNSSARVIGIAEILHSQLSAGITIAYESLDPTALENVKRSNLSLSQFEQVRRLVKSRGLRTHTDIILGLPGETLESYLNGLRQVFRQGFNEIITFNCRMLGGTELNTPEARAKYGIETKFRMLSFGSGIYFGRIAIDHEETVFATDTMSAEEILSLRPVNWLSFVCWNFGYYLEPLKLGLLADVNPVDVFLELIKRLEQSPSGLGKLFAEFQDESRNEWYDTAEELYADNCEVNSAGQLKADNFSKMNQKYTARVLFEFKDEMDRLLHESITELVPAEFPGGAAARAEFLAALNEVMTYCSLKFFDMRRFIDDGRPPQPVASLFHYDFPRWMADGGESPIEAFRSEPMQIHFYLSTERAKRISRVLYENSYGDVYQTYMKSLESIRIDDLFLNVTGSDEPEMPEGYERRFQDDFRSQATNDKAITTWLRES